MKIESVIYQCKIISNDQYAVRCIFIYDNGYDYRGAELVRNGSPRDWIEQCEANMKPEDELEIIDERVTV